MLETLCEGELNFLLKLRFLYGILAMEGAPLELRPWIFCITSGVMLGISLNIISGEFEISW